MQEELIRLPSRRRVTLALLALGSGALAACTVTVPQEGPTDTERRRSIDTNVDATLSKLYEVVPDSRALVQRASGALVFPSVIRVSFGVGGAHGEGALRSGAGTLGYYTLTAGSIGLQAGAQSQAVVILFMTPDALEGFRASKGWAVGADATVAVAKVGATGLVGTASAQKPVIAFVLTNVGLAAGVSLQGAKVSPLQI